MSSPTTKFLLLVAVIFAVAPALVWARAGGGEGFGGGGGGGDSDIGWIIEILYWICWLCWHYPKIGFPLLFIFIGFFVFSGFFAKGKYQDNVITRGQRAGSQLDQEQATAIMRDADPAFDAPLFLTRVRNAFMRMQDAWCAHDLESIRPFVSDGIAERFSLQFQEQRDAGYRNKMEHIKIVEAVLSDARTSRVFNSVTVCITASAADYRVSIADGKYVSGKRGVESFTEFWTFVRRGGVTSLKDKPGLLEGNCPNCGAAVAAKSADGKAISIGGSAKCAACKSLLHSGALDWVLTEITQATASEVDKYGAEASVQTYQENDPGFCPEHIEDRASVIFWRWAKSQRLGDIAPLRKVATPEFCESSVGDFKAQTDATGRRGFMGRCAVGAVDMLGVLPGKADSEWDRAVVRLEWSGTRLAVKPGTRETSTVPGGGLSVTIATLIRRKGMKSDPGVGLSSSHCPSCGAAQSDDAADACAYCATVLNDGQADWVLSGFHNSNSAEARAVVAELNPNWGKREEPATGGDSSHASTMELAPTSVTGMIGWLAQVIAEDGVVTDEELRLFQATCENHSIPTRESEAILAGAKSGSGGTIPSPANPREAIRWLQALAETVADHGKLAAEDQQLMKLAAVKLGLSDADVRRIAKLVRSQSLRDAREALRTRKRNRVAQRGK